MSEFLRILGGVRILEIAEGIAGPVCGMQLADLGACVVKVEPPGGDRARQWGPACADGRSAIFEHLNRGKSSIIVDWRSAEDRDVLAGLLRDADVVVVHQDPETRALAGMAWRELCDANPRLCVCEISDIGLQGPLAGRAGSELVIQVLAGFHRYAGRPEAPCRVGYEIASVGGGMAAVEAVLAMLYRRERDGRGDYCEISLLGQLLSQKQILLAAQSDPDKWEGFHLNGPHWPADIGWETSDGQVTFDFRHGERDGWVKFCEAVGLGHLPDDPEYADWRSTIYIGDRKASHGPVYHAAFRAMTSQEASDLINGFGGISVKFHDYAEILAHPQMRHLNPLVSVEGAPEGATRQVATPFAFDGATVADPRPRAAPCPGDIAGASWPPGPPKGRNSP
ncbi:CoA transferase [Alsobacter sp. SYSU M60028]|uniref:CoA transferase n=1 Tax=Alsobacter ponti TaxID=2962936 RepID=A0ABT1LBA1_9HYPH|nr:CoA transferase [Alsobacter ponti]MCP8938767.1 CoA transferase [Alsobacter ponti]